MTPDEPTATELATMRALHREASDLVDARPDPRVRAAVLAEATRALTRDSKHASGNPFGAGRWPLSMAAALVVSVMVGLVANRTMRDEPERVAPVIVAASPATSAPDRPDPPIAADSANPGPPAEDSAKRRAAAPTDDARARDARRPKVSSPPTASSGAAAAPEERRTAMSAAAETDSVRRLEVAPSAAAAAPRQAPASDAAARRVFAQKTSSEPTTPEAWVERIVALRAAGQVEEADRELAALRLRHPDFTIPQAAIGSTGTR